MVTQDLDDLLKEENYVERVFKVILDSKNLSHSDQCERSKLLTRLFERLNASEDTLQEQQQKHYLFNILPAILWLYISLPTPNISPAGIHLSPASGVSSEQRPLLDALQSLIDQLEAVLIGYYKYFCNQKLNKNSVAVTSDYLPVYAVQRSLKRPNVFARTPVYRQDEKPKNPNMGPIRVSHYIKPSSEDIDDTIESLTSSTKSEVIETILTYFDAFLTRDLSWESLLVMLFFMERILCTDFVNTPVPYAPEIPFNVLQAFPEYIQQYYKSSIFIWSQICESFQPLASPMSPLPSAKIPYRFSISSSGGPASRKHSIPDPLRPSTAASTFSHGHGLGLGRESGGNSTIPASKVIHPIVPNSPVRSAMTSSLPVDFPPRLSLQRNTLRIILSILTFCHGHQQQDPPNNNPSSYSSGGNKPQQPPPHSPTTLMKSQMGIDHSGFWGALCNSQLGSKHVVVDAFGNTMEDKSRVGLLIQESSHSSITVLTNNNTTVSINGITTGSSVAGTPILPRSRALSDPNRLHQQSRQERKVEMYGTQEAFKYMVTKCVRTLYYRSANELVWEIAMGARCLLNDDYSLKVTSASSSTGASSSSAATSQSHSPLPRPPSQAHPPHSYESVG